ncbi:P-loop ATPase [Photobacterium proteolyticum]|uniref:tRNA(Met) cytidine acetyltransferase TmcA n=1 Tax=Photobacterium proteolyticum TaxID=1903952 RepID=A0A1Q9GFK5_9GAMM|nr:GNAT family N-acetyltransferase [Photobacterium proteolyticum]OLQ73204.1 P-loop ATPase [Photobacterium proteolyticum]
MSDLIHFCHALSENAKQANIRYLVVVEGDAGWTNELVDAFLQRYQYPLWAGETSSEHIPSVRLKKAKQFLGRECDCLIFNAEHAFDAEALGALSGTITGGGVLLLLAPSTWFRQTDEQSPFIRRLIGLLSLPDVIQLRQGLPLPPLPVVPSSQGDYSDAEFGCLTPEQYEAVAAIRRVVTGHRKRPLVLTADRGRGKSASLGIAAASLMSERRMRIGVTAPAYANTETLFAHAARRLGSNNDPQGRLAFGDSELVFLAPDVLLSDKPALDFLIVDEAAAIPAPMLNKLLRHYNRIAFASTVHGYEGTGRGFAIKFCQQLDALTPQWRQLKINQPIRWSGDDPLELWVFKTLLLDAEYAALEMDLGFEASDDIRYRYIPTDSLVGDESYLSQLFGLLVNAHYQTSPADLVQLLDDDAIHLVVAETKNHVVGCCLLSIEGSFAPELARQVMLGQRRPKGHLLAQSVAAHIGIELGAIQCCARVLRIAVHPDKQQQGIGQLLLQYCRRWAEVEKVDYLGTSFGTASELVDFWRKAGYTPVRLGVSKDAASGSHSLLMIQPISPESESWLRQAQSLFAANLNAQRVEQYRELDTVLFSQLFFSALDGVTQLSHSNTHLAEQQVRIYVGGGLGYDLVVASLEVWLSNYLSGKQQALDTNDYMAVAKILQRQPWSTIVSDYGFTSRKMAEKSLREYVSLRAQ